MILPRTTIILNENGKPMPPLLAASAPNRQYRNTTLLLPTVVAILIVVAHAILIPIGNWRYDEFDMFRYIREGGFPFVWGRIMGWSPRPLSEMLLYGYGSLVDATGQSHLGLFLGLLWLLLFGAVFLPIASIVKHQRPLLLPNSIIGVVMLAMFLAGHRIDEVFFWTQGAAAYMTTLAAIVFIMMLHLCAREASPTLMYLSSFAAAAAALSSEMGAAFAIAYGSSMFFANLVGARSLEFSGALRHTAVETILPIAVGLLVFYLVSNGRMTSSTEVVGNLEIARHIIPSLQAAISFMPRELLSLGSETGQDAQLIFGSLVAVGFCLGAFALFAFFGMAKDRWVSYRILAIGLASLAAVLVSLLAAYYQFGLVCCSRHETMRRCLAVLSSVCFMSFAYSQLAGRLPAWLGKGAVAVAASLLLTATMTASLAVSFRPLAADLKNYDKLSSISRGNWESGMSPGPAMTFQLSTSEMVCSPGGLVPGTYRNDENMPAPVGFLARYFAKTEVVIAGTEQACQPI